MELQVLLVGAGGVVNVEFAHCLQAASPCRKFVSVTEFPRISL
jgi:hypothetical protein